MFAKKFLNSILPPPTRHCRATCPEFGGGKDDYEQLSLFSSELPKTENGSVRARDGVQLQP